MLQSFSGLIVLILAALLARGCWLRISSVATRTEMKLCSSPALRFQQLSSKLPPFSAPFDWFSFFSIFILFYFFTLLSHGLVTCSVEDICVLPWPPTFSTAVNQRLAVSQFHVICIFLNPGSPPPHLQSFCCWFLVNLSHFSNFIIAFYFILNCRNKY